MYAQFFGLKQAPFSIAPDPRYLFMSERHREALAHLLYGVGGGGGFVVLTGEIGAGKTTVCRCFLEQIPRRCNVAYIFNPKLTVAELLKSVCDEFHVPYAHQGTGQATIKDYVDPLNEYLLRTHAVGQNNVLIIDEAQNLSPDVLEQLRLLTNLETTERKLLQIILIGQPELRTMLSQPELEQLAQRVIAHFHLDALSEDETNQYIQHRLSVAGLKRGKLFDSKAVHRIHLLSKGVPRRINLLCDRALLGAYAEGKNRVDRAIVDKAAQEVFTVPKSASGMSAGSPASTSSSSLTTSRARKKRKGGDWRPWVAGGLMISAMATLAGVAWMHQHQNNLRAGKAVASGVPASAAATPTLVASTSLTSIEAPLGQQQQPAPPLLQTPPLLPWQQAMQAVQPPSSALHAVGGQMSTTLTPPPFDTAQFYATAFRREGQALRALAPYWQITLSEGDACTLAAQQQLACFRALGGGLALARQLNRPAVLLMHDNKEQAMYAVLTGLHDQVAMLQVDAKTFTVPLTVLATMWRGDLVTYWHTPPAFRGKVLPGQNGPIVDWLAVQMARIDKGPAPQGKQVFDASLQARVYAFQMAQGLKPDGVAGATTFMQINRAIGVDEPRLQSGPPAGR